MARRASVRSHSRARAQRCGDCGRTPRRSGIRSETLGRHHAVLAASRRTTSRATPSASSAPSVSRSSTTSPCLRQGRATRLLVDEGAAVGRTRRDAAVCRPTSTVPSVRLRPLASPSRSDDGLRRRCRGGGRARTARWRGRRRPSSPTSSEKRRLSRSAPWRSGRRAPRGQRPPSAGDGERAQREPSAQTGRLADRVPGGGDLTDEVHGCDELVVGRELGGLRPRHAGGRCAAPVRPR